MLKPRGLTASLLLALLLFPGVAHAYIDPGTTQSLFAVIAPLLAIVGIFLGYLLWPFRTVLGALFRRGKPTHDAPATPTGDAAPTEPSREAESE